MTPDRELLNRFNREIKAKVPHIQDRIIVNATPLVDITSQVVECARTEYRIDVPRSARVFGKFDSDIHGGSVKVRPAVRIIEDAITSGKLRSGQVVFEATSGNFGLALGMLRVLGLDVIALVSRRLQEGVSEQLRKDGVKTVDLDVDICPAPGLKMDQNHLVAKTTATNVRQQLEELGLDVSVFDRSRSDVESYLARQDVIGLAKLLARMYGGFCPEQYDNELNVASHEGLTGPEIAEQLHQSGFSISEFRLVCTFGTGGTSTGLSKYVQRMHHDKKNAHVVFPLGNQDVAGIRTRDKALGLRFYQPELYAGQHEVDFEAAKRVLRFFAGRGYNIGESSALAIYACIQMLNYGVGDKFVVIVADGIEKYVKNLDLKAGEARKLEVTFQEATANLSGYEEVLWTHANFVPKEEGVKLLASSLHCDPKMVKIARAQDVQTLLTTGQLPEAMRRLLPANKGRTLLVCMSGGTSLRVAELLSKLEIEAESVTGGIMEVTTAAGRYPAEVVQVARE